MTLGIDYLTPFHDPGAIKNAGYDYVLRYLRNLTPGEVTALHAVGLGVGLISESTAQRALQGTPAGSEDATTANAQADALGVPESVPIFYTVDFGATPAEFVVIESYFVGVEAGNKRPVGGYGSDAVIDALIGAKLISVGWQTEAWSGTTVSGNASLYQRVKPTLSLAGSYDEDVEVNGKTVAFWTSMDVPVVSEPQPGPEPEQPAKPVEAPYPPFPGRLLRLAGPPYITGADVRTYQQRMVQRGWNLAVDNVYGPKTENVTIQFQTEKKLVVDGIVGAVTWDASWTAPVTK